MDIKAMYVCMYVCMYMYMYVCMYEKSQTTHFQRIHTSFETC
jgi:hypothetical protein